MTALFALATPAVSSRSQGAGGAKALAERGSPRADRVALVVAAVAASTASAAGRAVTPLCNGGVKLTLSSNGATGGIVEIVKFTRTESAACRLRGTLTLAIRRPDGTLEPRALDTGLGR